MRYRPTTTTSLIRPADTHSIRQPTLPNTNTHPTTTNHSLFGALSNANNENRPPTTGRFWNVIPG
jgi:hypothetical protein